MTDQSPKAWSGLQRPDLSPVPPGYRGVWTRTLLQTPDLRDDTTFVRWMQLGRWHADLRIPAAVQAARSAVPLSQCSPEQRALLATQQGFCGLTQVATGEAGEVCTWHRVVDYQPPGLTPDAGIMVFETPACVVETGVHGIYREIWHRLPDSTGRLIALSESEPADGQPSVRLFIAGRYLMRVWPRQSTGPDFEISFGPVDAGRWHIEQSTLPWLVGQHLAISVQRQQTAKAQIQGDLGAAQWDVLEWEDA